MDNENFTIERDGITYTITDGYPTNLSSTTSIATALENTDISIARPEDHLKYDNPKKRNHRRKHIREHYDEDLFYLLDEETATDVSDFIAEKANTTIYRKTYRDDYERWEKNADTTTGTYPTFVMWIRPSTQWTAEHFMKEWHRQRD